jgi:hypothetical protein
MALARLQRQAALRRRPLLERREPALPRELPGPPALQLLLAPQEFQAWLALREPSGQTLPVQA